jgi:hypothetical protein
MIADEKHLEMMKRLLMTDININIAVADEKHLEMMKRLLMTDININIAVADNNDD